ncbi:hypothetical protein ACFLSI_00360 [Bacteroidota bacterium]
MLTILLGCKKDISDPENKLAISFTQKKIGTRLNIQDSGAWWGEQIVKIVEYNGSVYTITYVDNNGARTAYLNKIDSQGSWTEGLSFQSSRIPTLLVDSSGFIHLIGFEPYSNNDYRGRLYHVKFNTSENISGNFKKSYISEDTSQDTYIVKERNASIFYGAAIGKDNTIMTVYNNSPDSNSDSNNSLAVRINTDNDENWVYEDVVTGSTTNYAYPFAFVGDTYYHVLAVEDKYDEYYVNAGSPYNGYPYRYGQIRHWQRLRSGGSWEETTLINLNETLTKKEIWNSILRIHELYVDKTGTIHAILRYKINGRYKSFHYTKNETASTWTNQTILPSKNLYWAKLWEKDDNRLFYITCSFGNQLWLTPVGTTDIYNISDLTGDYARDMTPFPANQRGGTKLGSDLNIVVYGGSNIIEGYYIKVNIILRLNIHSIL